MELLKFKDYEHYKQTQWKTVKMRRRNGFSSSEIQLACDYLKANLADLSGLSGICHGVRNGLEAEEFIANLPGASVIGTDLFASTKLLPDGFVHRAKMVEWDFSHINPEWTGAMDWVYSNALDHSATPQETLQTWVEQLKPTGFAFIQWTLQSTGVRRGDCFSCDISELLSMANSVGTVVDLIYLGESKNHPGTFRVLVVIRPR